MRPSATVFFYILTSDVVIVLEKNGKKKNGACPRYLALNERSDTIRCQSVVLRYALLFRGGGHR